MDLLDRVELRRRVRGQHARQPGREPRAQHHVQTALARLGVELEQGADLAQRVGDGDDVRAGLQCGLGERALRHRCGEQDDVGAVERLRGGRHLPRRIAERAHDIGGAGRARLDEREVVDRAGREQLTGGAPAHRARPDDDRAHG